MKKMLITICLMVGTGLMVGNVARCNDVNEPNQPKEKKILFQNIPWGCSEKVVREKMGDPNSMSPDKVCLSYFPRKVCGLNATYIFLIKKDQFLRAKIGFLESHINDNLYLDDFKKIDVTLTEKYGPCTGHFEFWKNELYKDDPSHWGFAMSMGDLVWASKWVIGDVTIIHMADGDNFDISHVIEYSEKHMSKIEDAIDKEKEESQL